MKRERERGSSKNGGWVVGHRNGGRDGEKGVGAKRKRSDQAAKKKCWK